MFRGAGGLSLAFSIQKSLAHIKRFFRDGVGQTKRERQMQKNYIKTSAPRPSVSIRACNLFTNRIIFFEKSPGELNYFKCVDNKRNDVKLLKIHIHLLPIV